MKTHIKLVKTTKTPKNCKKNQIIHQNDTQKTPENSQNTPLQEEPINTLREEYILTVKNITYVLTPTQTTLIHIDIENNFQTLTHTDTRKQIAEKPFYLLS